MHVLNKRGDSTTNIILFLAVVIAAIILVTWYVQSITPTRQIISTVLDDADELKQHLQNACAATIYRATYLTSTSLGEIVMNATHLCVVTTAFGTCEETPCTVAETRIQMSGKTLLNITKNNSDVRVTTFQP